MDHSNLQTCQLQAGEYRITLNKRGWSNYSKQRSPVFYGIYSEIETASMRLQFNVNHELVRAEGRGKGWPSDLEFLKRTAGNDWVYYSTGGYTGSWETLSGGVSQTPVLFRIPEPYSEVFKTTGEYYLPNLSYDSNAIIGREPFNSLAVRKIVDGWYKELEKVWRSSADMPEPFSSFLAAAMENSPEILQRKADNLFAICDGRMSVLPPDSRHVDYNVIPLNISRGCLYKCRFCTVKSKAKFTSLTRTAISEQIDKLAAAYGENLCNYNAIFLGEHDALSTDDETILFSIECAVQGLGLNASYMNGSNAFLFGSVRSLMNKGDGFFNKLNQCGLKVFINIGLESADQETLDYIGKPLKRSRVIQCFERMQTLNATLSNIEFTANFLFDEKLPTGHMPALMALVGDVADTPKQKGSVYLSPLCLTPPSARTLYEFKQLKTFSNNPMYLYLIQRL